MNEGLSVNYLITGIFVFGTILFIIELKRKQ